MLQKFLTLEEVPELRSEPVDPEKGVIEIELHIPTEIYWDLLKVIKNIRYAQNLGISSAKEWQKLARITHKYIVFEKDRLWFIKNLGSG